MARVSDFFFSKESKSELKKKNCFFLVGVTVREDWLEEVNIFCLI